MYIHIHINCMNSVLVTQEIYSFRQMECVIYLETFISAFAYVVLKRSILATLSTVTTYIRLIKRSNLTQQYADIYLLQSHSTCFGCHSAHHQEH